jgi:hypothetical protein
MKRAWLRQHGRDNLELLEEAVWLVRRAPAATLACYYIGALPFVLGLLFFWADMSRSALARERLPGAAFGMCLLFLWLKAWQTVYARRLRAHLADEPQPRWTVRGVCRMLVAQMVIQPSGLFLIPLSLLMVIPSGWVFAFYQNITVLADGGPGNLRTLVKKAWRLGLLWPRQNAWLLVALAVFGVCVFLNWISAGLMIPMLLKTFLGIESVFTRGAFSFMNSTFMATMAALTFLSLDPVVKAVYILRCFQGESLHSGADLRVEIRRFAAPARTGMLALLLAVAMTCPAGCMRSDDAKVAQIFNLPYRRIAFCQAHDYPTALKSTWACRLHICDTAEFNSALHSGSHRFRHDSVSEEIFPEPSPARGEPAQSTPAAPASPAASAPAINPDDLDRSISDVLRQREYAWRMPREKPVVEKEEPGVIARFFADIRKWAAGCWEKLSTWLEGLLDRFFRRRAPVPGPQGSGWMTPVQGLQFLAIVVAACALALLGFRLARGWRKKPEPVSSEAMEPVPDVADENVGADQLPEDGWMKLGRELIERGEFRLAMRAFYLSSLAHLAGRSLITLARFKSNGDYRHELRRHAHAMPEMSRVFEENICIFDGVWYGLHEIDTQRLEQFIRNVEEMRGVA